MLGAKYLILFVTLSFFKDAWCKVKLDASVIGENKIVGGHITSVKKYPYVATIIIKNATLAYQCGGSIISPKFILTAAHCLYGMDIALVGTGITNLNELEEEPQSRMNVRYSRSKALYCHENYKPESKDFDVGLIELTEPIKLDCVKRKAISLSEYETEIPGGTVLAVTGWGATSENGTVSYNLNEVEVPTLSQEECSSIYLKRFNEATMICAGYKTGGKDSCQGDSGGPAVDKLTNTQVGIVSFGAGCARKNYPGVYAKVASPLIRPWIKKISGV